MADKRIKDLTNTAAESDIASGNYFALDGSAGTKKLNSTTLLTKTAQNALAGNVAPAFVPNTTNAKAGKPYIYNGALYIAKEDYNGAWDASKFERAVSDEVFSRRASSLNSQAQKGDLSQSSDLVLGVSSNEKKLGLDLLTNNSVRYTFEIVHKIFNTSGVGGNNNNYDAIQRLDVSEGDVVVITASIGSSYYALMAFDSAGTLVENLYKNGDFTKQVYTVPSGVSYLILQGRNETWNPPKKFEVAFIEDVSKQNEKIKALESSVEEVESSVENVEESIQEINEWIGEQSIKFSLIGNASLDKYEELGRVVNVTSGNVGDASTSYPNAKTTKKIRVNPGSEIFVSGFASQYLGFVGYNASGVYVCDLVSSRDASLNKVAEGAFEDLKITVPQNVYFIAGCTRDYTSYELATYIVIDKMPKMVFTPVYSSQFFVDVYQDETKFLRHQFVKQQYSKSCTSEDGLITETIECADCWRHDEIYDFSGTDSAKKIMQGNSNFIYNVDSKGARERAYIGPGHGGCIADFYHFFIDGESITYGGTQKNIRFCEKFSFAQKLNCYAPDASNPSYTNEQATLLLDNEGNKILTAVNYLEWSIVPGNNIEIRNKLVIKRDGISFYLANGAMLEVRSPYFDKVIQDTLEVTKNTFEFSEGSWDIQAVDGSSINLGTKLNNKVSHVVSWGDDYKVEQTMAHIDGQGDSDNSIYNMFYGGTGPRLKMYFKPCGCAVGNDVVPKKTFNTDDYMEVAVVRKICVK